MAVNGLHARDPDQSARSKLARWQRYFIGLGAAALAVAVALAPLASMRTVSFALAFASLPLIALRVLRRI